MTDEHDVLVELLAKMLEAGISYRTDTAVYADRIAERLGLGEDDSAEVIAAELRKALGLASCKPGRSEASDYRTVDLIPDGYGNLVKVATAGAEVVIIPPPAPGPVFFGAEGQERFARAYVTACREAQAQGAYKVEGMDGFDPEADYYPLSEHSGYDEALEAARARLRELNESQPGAGGQGGIQDRVYVVHPDGRRQRVFS